MSSPGVAGGARGAAPFVLPLYALTLFLSAFLLFALQPMFTKLVMPLLGGSAAVWNTAVVFFQATLLLGYLYAHLSTRLLGPRRQTILHGVVLALGFLALPIGVAAGWTPPTGGTQIPWLIGLLAVSIGLPFFAVSATAPLLQKWFAHTDHAAAGDPYFLYGGSNLGSLTALLAYPFLIEPALGLRNQGLAWTIGYAALAAAIATCGATLWRRYRADEVVGALREQPGLIASVTWKLRARWLLYSVVPSALLLGVTLHIGTDIASVPFLWVLPLALYLLTFVLVFARRPLLSQRWMRRAQIGFVALLALLFQMPNLYVLLGLHVGAMFFTAMVCHGELARLRPVAAHLTEFYLWMSIGGVVGGILAGIVAPLVFDGVYEYPLALVLALLLRPSAGEGRILDGLARLTRLDRLARRSPAVAWAVEHRVHGWALDVLLPLALWWSVRELWWRKGLGKGVDWVLRRIPSALDERVAIETWAYVLTLAVVLVWLGNRPLRAALGFVAILSLMSPDVLGGLVGSPPHRLMRERSFFGVYSVVYSDTEGGRFHSMLHGTTNHGAQNLSNPCSPFTYYMREGPIGQFFGALKNARHPVRRIGVIGLGAGALVCWVAPGQSMTFFEIDPLDEAIARDPRYFTYLSGCGKKVDVVIGDGRLKVAEEEDGAFDLIVIDAFSGDSIPAHLLTREALETYFSKLSEDGLLLIHVTNAYLDLLPVVGNLVADAGFAARYAQQDVLTAGQWASTWVAIAREPASLAPLVAVAPPWKALEPDPDVDVWTDDFTNVLQVLRWQTYAILGQ